MKRQFGPGTRPRAGRAFKPGYCLDQLFDHAGGAVAQGALGLSKRLAGLFSTGPPSPEGCWQCFLKKTSDLVSGRARAFWSRFILGLHRLNSLRPDANHRVGRSHQTPARRRRWHGEPLEFKAGHPDYWAICFTITVFRQQCLVPSPTAGRGGTSNSSETARQKRFGVPASAGSGRQRC